MNNDNKVFVVNKLKTSSYINDFIALYGSVNDVENTFNNIADALSAYELAGELTPFTSKYDYFLKGEVSLTTQEKRGMELFKDTLKGKCAKCHIMDADEITGNILFTDFSYDNIGVPKNPDNPYYTIPSSYNPFGASYIDLGLGAVLNDDKENGKFKVPSMRNAAISAPYFHNGFYNTLEEVVHFYNKRDVEIFPPAEVLSTVNKDELGDLKLTPQEEKDIVAFIKTLTDGYR
jgi:cytochrome c peroxidase